jgi:hypothetical protein
VDVDPPRDLDDADGPDDDAGGQDDLREFLEQEEQVGRSHRARKLPTQHAVHAPKIAPKAIIDCIAWNRTAGRSRSTSQTSAPVAHHAE